MTTNPAEERADKAFREVCLVLTGMYPENLSDTSATNKLCARNIILDSITKSVADLQSKNTALQGALKEAEEALLKSRIALTPHVFIDNDARTARNLNDKVLTQIRRVGGGS